MHLIILLFSCCLFSCLTTYAQSSEAKITKGYYSIYNNAAKLNTPPSTDIQLNQYLAVNKGYYAIWDNRNKLFSKRSSVHGSGQSRPVQKYGNIMKGYYSISKNSEKLK